MTTEPSLPLGEVLPTPISTAELRTRLRLRLERHVQVSAFQPLLTVVGFTRRDVTVLRHGIDQPEDAVLELVVPQRYGAVGVLASSVITTRPHRTHRDAALALAVPRSGPVVTLLASNGSVTTTQEPQGWLVDACLRSVGRPTPPTQVPPLDFPIALWLDRLMVALLNGPSGESLSWQNSVRLCPVPAGWRSEDPIDLGSTLGSTTRSWAALRGAAAAGERAPLGISPERAKWMDDAMFARWCMGSFPDLASLRGDVEFLAPAEVAENIELTLRAARIAFAG